MLKFNTSLVKIRPISYFEIGGDGPQIWAWVLLFKAQLENPSSILSATFQYYTRKRMKKKYTIDDGLRSLLQVAFPHLLTLFWSLPARWVTAKNSYDTQGEGRKALVYNNTQHALCTLPHILTNEFASCIPRPTFKWFSDHAALLVYTPVLTFVLREVISKCSASQFISTMEQKTPNYFLQIQSRGKL